MWHACFLCISHKNTITVCVSITSPCSLSRSAVVRPFCKSGGKFMEAIIFCLNIIMLNNFSDNKFKFGQSRNKMHCSSNHRILTRTVIPDRSNEKPQNRLKTTSSGNRVLYIADYSAAFTYTHTLIRLIRTQLSTVMIIQFT